MSLVITIIGLCVVLFITQKITNLFENNNNQNLNTNYNNNYNDTFEKEKIIMENTMKKITKEEIMIPMLIAKIMEENPKYITSSYYDLSVDNDEFEIVDTEDVFENVSPQLLCLKLVHNISMMSAFVINYVQSSGASVKNSASTQKRLFLKLSISAENIDIVQKKGFGLFGYNVDDMAYALNSFYYAMKDYLQELAQKKKYNFLERVLKEYMHLFTRDPNTAMIEFLNNNKDFYEKQIKEIEQILADENI